MRTPIINRLWPQRALIEATGAGFELLKAPVSVLRDFATAFRSPRLARRPIVLNMPPAIMWEPTAYERAVAGVPALATFPPGESDALNEAIGILASARRPLILAGRGAIHAREALLALADRIGGPVATTLKAKGLFNGAPYDLGVCGTLITPAAGDVIASADCILAFGVGLSRFTTVHGAYLEGTRVVQIDDDVRQFGRRQSPDVMLAGDPVLVAERILHWLDEAKIPSSQPTDTVDLDAQRAGYSRPVSSNTPGKLDYSHALELIDAAFPEDRNFVSDAGRPMTEAWCRIGVSAPRHIVPAINAGAIGHWKGYAIGAAVARLGQ